jgi:SAM-dependent methyltransferase
VCEYAVEDAMKLSSSGSGSGSTSDSSATVNGDSTDGSDSSSSSGSASGGDTNTPQYDLTWSMESGEHMPHKEQFVNELYRVTAPGGRIIIVTWCHRELAEGEGGLRADEVGLLGKISDAYYLPEWCAASLYVAEAERLGLTDVRQVRDDSGRGFE